MNSYLIETIAAVATPAGSGGVAIVRLSGPESLSAACKLLHKEKSSWKPRFMHLCRVYDEEDRVIDQVLAVYMPSPHSYTGEDVVEIHCHGGWVIPNLITDRCISCGARLAEPGEFTYRAFLSGKMNLAEAEAVLSLIEAKSKDAAVLAAESLNGALSLPINSLKNDILNLIAQYEAEIDYGDEIGVSDTSALASECSRFLKTVNELLEMSSKGRDIIDGIKTVLVGPPNAGKSTLWNALIGKNKALVTPYPGTTRDVLEEYVNIGGICLHLIDTAGLHETEDAVEKLGIAKTRDFLSQAELVIAVIDGSSDIPEDFCSILSGLSGSVLAVLNKRDCGSRITGAYLSEKFGISSVETSLKFGHGLDSIKESVINICKKERCVNTALSINQRQRQVLVRLRDSLLAMQSSAGMPCDCLLLDLRECLEAINELTGENVSEDILDRVFSKFCLGK